MAKILFEKWISYHKCPRCGSSNTFHSHAMENLDMEVYGNIWAIGIRVNHFNPNDQTLHKSDLCLECGSDWVTFIQRIDSEGQEGTLAFKSALTGEIKTTINANQSKSSS